MEKFVDDNVERGKETYPRDDTSGHVCGQASFELVLLYGGGTRPPLLCGQKEGVQDTRASLIAAQIENNKKKEERNFLFVVG